MTSRDKLRSRRGCRIISILALGLIVACLVGAGASALSNLTFPERPKEMERLSDLDKARLAEALNLKAKRGETIWPGWGNMEMPYIIWNNDYSFLVGMDNPGSNWEKLGEDSFLGEPYFQRRSIDPQNFAVQVGDRWAASMATKNETDQKIREIWQEVLPPPFEQVFPYRVLLQPSEVQMTAVLHESFHVFQMEQAQGKLEDAEKAYRHEDAYWLVDEAMGQEWGKEIDLLARALETSDHEEIASLVGEFLRQREERRQAYNLAPALIALEQKNEWLEGLAKYIELKSWHQAWISDGYEPLPLMEEDGDFKGYESYEQRMSQEIAQMKRQANTEGVTRFYYTGMAQAELLDRLYPGWKDKVMGDGIWLEDLLAEAIG